MKKNPIIKIFVTYKEKHKVLKSDIITPIQTGREIADEIFDNMIGDNTGKNISQENPKYNELSAQYWVWKNYDKIDNPKYIGFMHYRRHFLFNEEKDRPEEKWLPNSSWYSFEKIDDDYMHYFSDKYIIEAVKGFDCIVPKAYNYSNYMYVTLVDDYKNLYKQKVEHFHLMLNIVKEMFPSYSETVESIRHGHIKYIANMFVMSKEMFFEYCNFLFSIEKEVDKKVDSSFFDSHEIRFLGFLGEIILTLFITQMKKEKKYCIKEMDTSFVKNTDENIINIRDNKGRSMKKYALAVSSSCEYALYLSVYLQSIINNWKKEEILNVFVFERNISKSIKEKLLNQVAGSKVNLNFVDPSYLFPKNLYISQTSFKDECYYRIAAPLVLNEYEKILFTDLDLVFNRDFSEIFEIDLKDKILASVKDPIMAAQYKSDHYGTKKYIEEKLGMKNPYNYLNTGVVLFNTKLFNEDNAFHKILNLSLEKKFILQEQDAISSIYSEQTEFLPLKYNFTPYTSLWKSYNFIESMPYKIKQEYLKCYKNAVVVHWACGGVKPWFHPEEEIANIWWLYARQTPFYEEILSRMIDIKISQYQKNAHLIYIISNLSWFKIKKIWYKLNKNLAFTKHRRDKYKEKYKKIKQLIKNAKKLKKQILK